MTTVHDEIIDQLAAAPGIAKFQASRKLKDRVADLIARSKLDELSKAEEYELHHYLALEQMIMLAKARARANSNG